MIEQILGFLVEKTGIIFSIGLFVVAGVALLKQSADGLVMGSSNIGLRLGISKVLTGLTIVAFGTSAPELVVSTVTALDGRPEICLGNVIGSNLANTALILGISAMITPIAIQRETLRKEGLHSFLSILLVLVLAWIGKSLGRIDGMILLVVFSGWMIWLIRGARSLSKKNKMSDILANVELSFKERHWFLDLFLSLIGLGGLVLGANLLVEGAVLAARILGVPAGFVGITVIAIGTSLPELAVSIVAAMKGHPELTVGNVFGSNIFNALLILGVACLIRPFDFALIPGDGQSSLDTLLIDLPFTVFICALIIPLMAKNSCLGRWRGFGLVLIYCSFIAYLFMRLP